MIRLLAVVVGALIVGLTLAPEPAAADGAWLDGPATDWNTPGMAIPPSPHSPPDGDARCFDALVVPNIPAKQALVAAGWFLFNSPSNPPATPSLEIVDAQSGADGMCRPLGFQVFVFVDGAFAGTLSPVLMDSRTDGVITQTSFTPDGQIRADYLRYTDRDPLCCASARSTATFQIATVGGAPVVRRGPVTTVPTTAAPSMMPTSGAPPSPSPVRPPVQAPAQLPRGR